MEPVDCAIHARTTAEGPPATRPGDRKCPQLRSLCGVRGLWLRYRGQVWAPSGPCSLCPDTGRSCGAASPRPCPCPRGRSGLTGAPRGPRAEGSSSLRRRGRCPPRPQGPATRAPSVALFVPTAVCGPGHCHDSRKPWVRAAGAAAWIGHDSRTASPDAPRSRNGPGRLAWKSRAVGPGVTGARRPRAGSSATVCAATSPGRSGARAAQSGGTQGHGDTGTATQPRGPCSAQCTLVFPPFRASI